MSIQPSILKILIVDYTTFAGWLVIPVSTLMFAFFSLTGGAAPAPLFLGFLAAICLIGVGVVAWRIALFKSVFDDGIQTTDQIISLFFFRDRGRVEYVYTYQGQKYISGNAVHKVRSTKELEIGQTVTLIIDRNNPKRAFIQSLYV